MVKARCPQNWIGWNDKCYFRGGTVQYFDENYSICKAMNASMVTIESREENAFLTDLLYTNEWLFVGARRVSVNSTQYKWNDGEVLRFLNWNSDQPNQVFEEGFDCINVYHNGYWSDTDCVMKSRLFCERRQSDECNDFYSKMVKQSESYLCPRNWVQSNEKCFFVGGYVQYFDENLSACKAMDASMVTIESTKENDFVSKLLFPTDYFFLGAKRIAVNSTHYQWNDGKNVSFRNWHSQQPNNVTDEGVDYIVVHWSGYWYDVAIKHRATLICEKKLSDAALRRVVQKQSKQQYDTLHVRIIF
ncbi:macrophage mannose receptor 1-like protein [Leptotrombidium deliense]|uniref:Macrophage mannose receptor 1-like protein n=1 Tax=Leptotrombidium deliense TaxID=299467 RepID=A0A443S7D0_9ACAR|nr:macrophage mannose receptor 1-like protein [Leptotrombidium deliense]